MRVCILTLPLYTNYGGLLQAYALQTVLNRLGHEVWVENRKNNKVNLWIFIKRLLISLLSRISSHFIKTYYPNQRQQDIIGQYTDQFIHKYINVTIPIYSINKEKLLQYKFDAYIVGSDQVWRPKYSRGIANYFLDFTDGENVKKIAYAASFGTDRWEFTPKMTKRCAKLLKKFDAVSVREDSGVILCERFMGVEAIHLLDPTLLLNQKDYIDLVLQDNAPEFRDKLFTYILDESEEKRKIVNFVSEKLKLTPFSVMPKKIFDRVGTKYLEQCIFPPVTSWLRAFMDAEYIVTDSFHGTVFSIIFNKPFIVIANQGRGLGRFTSLLKMFNLEKRLIYSIEDLSDDLLLQSIDYHQINEIRYSKCEDSIKFLRDNL